MQREFDMSQVLHGSARRTEVVRRAIKLSQESVKAAAKRYGISSPTVQKRRDRETTADTAMGPKAPRSTDLTPGEEAIIFAPAPHSAAAGRLPLRPAIDHSALAPLQLTSLSEAARHQPLAGGRGRYASGEAFCSVPDWLGSVVA